MGAVADSKKRKASFVCGGGGGMYVRDVCMRGMYVYVCEYEYECE